MAKLVRAIMSEMGDECMGFTPRRAMPGAFNFAVGLAMEGKTVAEGLTRAIKCSNFSNPDIHAVVSEVPQGIAISFEFEHPELDPQNYFGEFCMIIWHRLCCWLAAETITIISADFDYSYPSKYFEEFKYLFPCEHNFDSKSRRLILDRHILYAPIRRTTEEAKTMLSRLPLELMTIPSSDQSTHRSVRQLLVQSPRLQTEALAEKLNISPNELRQKLRSEGYKVSKVREFVRRDLAIQLLLKSNRRIDDIAEELGYSEARSFTRAFKVWTSKSPSEYRSIF